MMPVVDPRRFTPTQADDLVGLFEVLARRPALPIGEEMRQTDRQALDLWLMRYLFGEDADQAARAVERALRDLVGERISRAASGREQEGKATRRTTFNPTPVAARVLLESGMPPALDEWLADLRGGELATVTIEIPPHSAGRPAVGSTLLDQGDVLIDGKHLLTAPSDSHSDAIVAILTVKPEFAGTLVMPADEGKVAELERKWRLAWDDWRKKVLDGVKAAVPRAQHEQRRKDVVKEILKQAKLLSDTLASE
jgi:hypothetical protein